MEINNELCFECDRPMDVWHHVVPKSRGGKKTIPLCNSCHSIIHNKDLTKVQDVFIKKDISTYAMIYFLIEKGYKLKELVKLWEGERYFANETKALVWFEQKYNKVLDFIRRGNIDILNKTIDEIFGNGSHDLEKTLELQLNQIRKAYNHTSDGPRYQAIGNSIAVPVMRWIGERIAKNGNINR